MSSKGWELGLHFTTTKYLPLYELYNSEQATQLKHRQWEH